MGVSFNPLPKSCCLKGRVHTIVDKRNNEKTLVSTFVHPVGELKLFYYKKVIVTFRCVTSAFNLLF